MRTCFLKQSFFILQQCVTRATASRGRAPDTRVFEPSEWSGCCAQPALIMAIATGMGHEFPMAAPRCRFERPSKFVESGQPWHRANSCHHMVLSSITPLRSWPSNGLVIKHCPGLCEHKSALARKPERVASATAPSYARHPG